MDRLFDLRAGDVLSYSAGSTQTGPEGFRKLVPKRRTMLEAAAARWPDLLDVLGQRPVIFLNTYPATIGTFTPGITVDTYLSPRVFSRALQLGHVGDHPVILLGQPLFVADVLLQHIAGGWPWPKTLMLWTGGYVMPRSLERALRAWLEPLVETFVIVQYFGAAEVDAGCLMARERTDQGGLIFHPREDIEVDVEGENLLLTLRAHDGGTIIERFATGDLAQRHGDGWVIRNPRRLHPSVEALMESWSEANWRRRTGYVRRQASLGGDVAGKETEETIWVQLREGHETKHALEVEHWDFGRRFGFSWLAKPNWR